MSHVRRTAAALVVAAVAMTTGCTSDEGSGPAPSSDEATSAPAAPGASPTEDGPDLSGDLPPLEAAALVDLYADELADLGVVLTDRGGLVDELTYEADPDGTHLSLYVAPEGDRDEETYLDGLVDVTEVFARDVFARWPGLVSFDVCQETVPTDGAPTGVPRTQVTLTREAAAAVDWASTDIEELDEVAREFEGSSLILLDEELRTAARRRLTP